MACSPCIFSGLQHAQLPHSMRFLYNFFTKQTMPLNHFLFLHIASTLLQVNFAGHIYKPGIWGVRKEPPWMTANPLATTSHTESWEGQNIPDNAIICRVYSHPCFLACNAVFVCVFLIRLAIHPHTCQPLRATGDNLTPAPGSVLGPTMVSKCVTSLLTC